MKRAAFGLLCLFVLLPVAAFADSLDSAAPYCGNVRTCPTAFTQYDFEQFVALKGTGNLLGNVDTQVDIVGPAGTFTQGISSAFAVDGDNGQINVTLVVAFPDDILIFTGRYAVTLRAIDDTGTRTFGPVYFDVVPQPVVPQLPLISVPEGVTGEADSPTGGHVTFSVTGFSFVDAVAVVSCDHNSGDFFPMGTTKVTCSATDSFGTVFGTFGVFVTDTAPPVVTVPASFSPTSAVVTFSASAVDAVDGSRPVSCSPASGTAFPNGPTTVTCTAEDTRFNVGSASFVVTVSDPNAPPSLTVPDFVVFEATGAAGAVVTYSVSATQDASIVCTPPSGSLLGITMTEVNCTATSAGGSTSASFDVFVADSTPPVLTVPSTINAAATSASGAVVNFTATSVDVVDGSVAVHCEPPSGSTFPVGTTTVQCYAIDAH